MARMRYGVSGNAHLGGGVGLLTRCRGRALGHDGRVVAGVVVAAGQPRARRGWGRS